MGLLLCMGDSGAGFLCVHNSLHNEGPSQKRRLFLCSSLIVFAAGSRDYLLRDRDAPGDLPAPARPRLRLQAGRGQREAQGT